jgi:hypothetical protein
MSMTTEQRASESAIRALIEGWAAAVHAGDLVDRGRVEVISGRRGGT